MSNPLRTRIRSLRRRLRRRAIGAGVCTVLAVVLATGLVIGTIDYLVRLEDPGLRIIATATLGAVLITAVSRYLRSPLRRRFSDIALAQNIERRHRHLGDLLSSAVAFSQESDGARRAGSAELRRAVIAQATAASEEINWEAIVPRRPVRRAVVVLGSILGVLAILFTFNRSTVQIAAARLLRPVGDDHWPRTNQLVVRNAPSRIAFGETLQIEVIDEAGQLPNQVWFHQRVGRDGEWDEQESLMTVTGDMAVARVDEVTRPIQYRVSGGDDNSMPWRDVDVVEPPRLRALTITLTPPAYTGYPPANSGRHIRAIEGTTISLSGESNEVLRTARLILGKGEPIEAMIDDKRHGFTVPAKKWIATRSTAYWFELVDEDNLVGGNDERYALRVSHDSPPTVAFEEPTGDLYVTPSATVPLRLLVKDNLAIHTVTLAYLQSDRSDGGTESQILWEGPASPTPRPSGDDPTRDSGDRRIVECRWDLGQLDLSAGTDLLVHATATDYRPGVGQTRSPRRIFIVTPDELEEQLTEQHALILGQLMRALRIEREAREGTRAVEIQLQEVGHLGPRDYDQLQTTALNQRQVERILVDPNEGIPRQIRALLDQMDLSRFDNPGMRRRLDNLAATLSQLEQNELPMIRRQLTTAIKVADTLTQPRIQKTLAPNPSAEEGSGEPGKRPNSSSEDRGGGSGGRSDASPQDDGLRIGSASAESDPVNASTKGSPSVAKSLADVGDGQDRVIEELEQLAGDLEQWAGYQRFARELGQLRNDQQALSETVRQELGNKSVDSNRPDGQHRVEFKKAAERQRELARRLDAIHPRLSAAIADLAEREPLVSQTLSDGLDVLQRRGIAGAMRDAGRNIERSRVGRALEQQIQATKDLEEVLDTLRNRRENELERLVKKLREAERELANLQDRLARLRENVDAEKQEETDSTEDEKRRRLERLLTLSKEQNQMKEDVERLARRLKRLTADRAGRTTERAASRLTKTGDPKSESPERESPERAGQGGGSVGRLEEAERDLEEAKQQLAEARRKAENDLADQQRARFESVVRATVEMQRGVLDETRRLDIIRGSTQEWTTGQAQSLERIADEQILIRDDTVSIAESAGGMGVLRLALRRAGIPMTAAAARLAEQKTGATTQEAETAAIARLEQILTALAEQDGDADDQQSTADKGGGGGGGEGGKSQGGDEPSIELAELKLLKVLQQDLRERTATLEQQIGDNRPPGDADQAAFRQMGDEQAQLAELVFALIDDDREADDGSRRGESEQNGDLPDLERQLEEDLKLPPLDILPFYGDATGQRKPTIGDPSDLDEELLKSLGDAEGEDLGSLADSDAPRDPVLRIAKQMRGASRAISAGDASGKASDLQTKAITELDKLIDRLKQRKRQRPSPSSGNKDSTKRSLPKQPSSKTAKKPSQRSNQPAKDASDRVDRGGENDVDMEAIQNLIKDLWGHLPPRTRERMLESPPEEFLPEFELEIEQYFRRLAEEPEWSER